MDWKGWADEAEKSAPRRAPANANGHAQASEPVPEPPLRILGGPELASPLPPLDYLVKGLGMVGGSGPPHVIAGYGFSGKTMSLQSMLLSLATGKNVWGIHSVKQRRVLHLDLEQGERETQRRYQRLAFGMGVKLEDVSVEFLGVISMERRLRLGEDMDLGRWREVMSGRDLIAIDSLRVVSAGIDENDKKISSCLDALGGLSEETGCRALLIHHARKPAQDRGGGGGGGSGAAYSIRGHSSIYDASDASWVFQAEENEPSLVKNTKNRGNGVKVDDFCVKIEDVARDGEPNWGVAVRVFGAEAVVDSKLKAQNSRIEQDAARVGSLIRQAKGIAKRELRAACVGVGLGHARCDAAVRHLVDLGLVQEVEERVGRGRLVRHYMVEL